MTKNKLLLVVTMMAFGFGANAAVIAVIDSGTDHNHQELKNKTWFNPKDIDDAVDNDDNGYIDDVNGWNFAEGNNKLFDKTLLGKFSPDAYKYFEVQTRLFTGKGTDEDIAWIRSQQQNMEFLKELQVFGNFVHGTHVAGIAARDASEAKIMGLKIIPTRTSVMSTSERMGYFGDIDQNKDNKEKLIKFGLKALAGAQAKQLAPIGEYVAKKGARIANCSFGTSTAAAKNVLAPLLKGILKRDPTEGELMMYSVYFVSEVVKSSRALVNPAKKTLFVIAAGNDGMNNDEFPTSPANIKLDNTITVAATLGYDKIAKFSNFGEKMVEVAAPGVGIRSSIPGQEYITVSGTSQAAPFVAQVAGRALDENPSLSNSDIKMILMATSDLKEFMKGKVASGGIMNPERAVLAAKLSMTMQLNDAIDSARAQINDVTTRLFEKSGQDLREEGYVMPLPGLFN